MIDEATFPLSNSGSLTVSQGHAERTISRTESNPVRVNVFMKMKEGMNMLRATAWLVWLQSSFQAIKQSETKALK